MKIALFTDTYLPQTNGVVAYLCDIIGALSKKHEVVLFAPGDGGFRREQVSGNFSIYWIPSSPFPFYESYRVASMDYRHVSALLSKEKPDIVHAHAPINLGLQGMIAGKRKGVPVVATYHTHYPDYVPHLLNGKLPSIFGNVGKLTAKKFVKHTFGMADIVTAPTGELVSELRSYGMKNVVPLQNGICLRKLKCTAKEAAQFRKAHSIPKGRRTVIYLGRISFEKRLDRLLEAYRMVEDGGKLLIIAGGGPSLEKFKALSASLGIRNIVFTGFVKRPAVAYAVADVFASASDSETFGLTFVEAMHMGLPVIGVRKLGAKEVITDMKDGLLVEPGDSAALAHAMKRLLEDKTLCGALAREGRKTARRFSIENSMKETIAIYEGLRKAR
jgi:glycosyltransferase involved in cell wall biosynthesis